MRYAQIIVTNDQAAPCSVQGYPTAQLRGASGAPLGGPAAQIAGSADRIDLGPGESASTLLQVTTADCAASSAAFLEVSLAGGARTQAPSDLPPCQPRLRPLAPGAEPVP
jgi:hypothetical protein